MEMEERALNGAASVPAGLWEAMRDLVAAIDRLEEGYRRLSPLLRSLAAGVLQGKTGMTLPEWRAWTTELEIAARNIGRAGPGETRAGIAVLLARADRDAALAGLAACARGVPEHAARFTRDPALLDELTRIAQEQEQRIQRARHLLQALADSPH